MANKKKLYRCAKCKGPVTKGGDGLGTWHCSNGCAKRKFFVNRFIGCGKENERNRVEAVQVRRPVAVEVCYIYSPSNHYKN